MNFYEKLVALHMDRNRATPKMIAETLSRISQEKILASDIQRFVERSTLVDASTFISKAADSFIFHSQERSLCLTEALLQGSVERREDLQWAKKRLQRNSG